MTLMFEPVFDSSLYQIPPAAAGGWCGYMLAPNDANPKAPFPLTTALSQANGALNGSFLFAPQAPVFTTADEANDFVAAVQKWLVPNGPFLNRFLVWLPVAGTSPVFGAQSFATASGYFAVPFSLQTAGFALSQAFNSGIGTNVTLVLGANVFLQPGTDGSAISLPFFETGAINLVAPSGTIALSNVSSPAAIPLTGASSGCIVLAGTITAAAPMTGMLAGLQFAYGPALGGPDVVQGFPVLDTAQGPSFATIAAFDPLDPFCTGAASQPSQGLFRTVLTVPSNNGAVPLLSAYRSQSNQPLTLLPQAAGNAAGPAPWDGGFVFQPATRLVIGTNTLPVLTSVYMAPAGDFALSVPGSTTPVAVLGGLAGMETLQLQPEGGANPPDILRFTCGYPAYTPVYPFPQASISQPASGMATQPLPATTPPSYITSWVQVLPGSAVTPTYSAQPRGNALFGPQGTNGDGTYGIAGALQPLTNIGSGIFPLVPWAQAGGGIPAGSWADYDSNVLSAVRRGVIQAQTKPELRALKAVRAKRYASRARLGTPVVTANGTTPQGLLAQTVLNNGITDYQAVVLAQSSDGSQMAFFNLNAELQGLFQTSQLFAVVIDPTNLGNFSQSNTVDIADWLMSANIGVSSGSSNVSNVMILKFCVGTLQDLVAKPSAWVDPADFSKPDPSIGVAVLSQALQSYISDAVGYAATNPLYANFAAIATNPEWQGIVVLGADLSVSSLPEQLAGLSAGIDFSTFRAHHFGVTVSPVTYGTTLTIQGSSSMFGLVDYQLPAYASNVAAGASPVQPLALPDSGNYGFTVLQLQALFINSAIADFRSHVQVTTNVLFGSKITASYVNGGQLAANSVVLTGTYQRQGKSGTYLFESDTPTVMLPDSDVVDSVILTKLMFNTLTNNDGETPPNIRSRILIWGAINFAIMQRPNGGGAFDILSYGMGADDNLNISTEGLAFSNLHIDLTSPVATPNTVNYQIVEDGIAFDQVSSTMREGSLVPGLVLQPVSFITAAAGATPASLGFLPVQLESPAPPQAALTGAWYGVSFLINMGGPGALASAAGFTSHLVLGWSPQTTRTAATPALFVGLQLPGASPGASAFSLQGVINLTVGNISLALAAVQGSTGQQAFTLRLRNIALSILGIVKLPPSATIDMFIFGDPGGTGSLGWYAAYIENAAAKSTLVPVEG